VRLALDRAARAGDAGAAVRGGRGRHVLDHRPRSRHGSAGDGGAFENDGCRQPDTRRQRRRRGDRASIGVESDVQHPRRGAPGGRYDAAAGARHAAAQRRRTKQPAGGDPRRAGTDGGLDQSDDHRLERAHVRRELLRAGQHARRSRGRRRDDAIVRGVDRSARGASARCARSRTGAGRRSARRTVGVVDDSEAARDSGLRRSRARPASTSTARRLRSFGGFSTPCGQEKCCRTRTRDSRRRI